MPFVVVHFAFGGQRVKKVTAKKKKDLDDEGDFPYLKKYQELASELKNKHFGIETGPHKRLLSTENDNRVSKSVKTEAKRPKSSLSEPAPVLSRRFKTGDKVLASHHEPWRTTAYYPAVIKSSRFSSKKKMYEYEIQWEQDGYEIETRWEIVYKGNKKKKVKEVQIYDIDHKYILI